VRRNYEFGITYYELKIRQPQSVQRIKRAMNNCWISIQTKNEQNKLAEQRNRAEYKSQIANYRQLCKLDDVK
jgi:hypothetical protein